MGLRRNVVWLSLSKIVSMAVLFITGSLINRSLGPSGRGVLAEMQTWVGLFIAVFGISIDTATYHFANKAVYKADDKTKFVTIFILNVVFALLATLALTVFAFNWPKQVSSKTIEFLYLLDVFLIISMLNTNLSVFFQAIGNIRFAAFIGIIRAVANIAIIGMGYVLKILNLKFVISSMIIVQAVGLIAIFTGAFKQKFLFGRFSKDMAVGLITKGLKQHIAMISFFIYTRINQLIVFKYCGEASAGIFAVALTLALYLMLIPEVFQTALYPRVIHSDDDYEVTARSLRFGFYGWGGITILAMLFAKPLLLIYGGKGFLNSIPAFRMLMIAVWLLPVSSFITPYYVKKGAFGLGAFFAVMLGVISIGLNLILVPRYSFIGAAAATSLSCVAGFCISLIILGVLAGKNPLRIFKADFKNLYYIRT